MIVAACLLVSVAVSARAGMVPADGAAADSTADRSTNIKVFPYAYYTPETEFAVGVGGIMTFYTADDKILRPSKMVLSGYYTTSEQYKFTLNPELYFSRNEYFAGIDLSFGHYVDKFYGVGNDTPDLGTEGYVADRSSIEVTLEIPPIFFVSDRSGLIWDLENTTIVDTGDNPYLQEGSITGSSGGTVSGSGLGWIWDSRNQSFYPTAGDLHQIKMLMYTSATGSDYRYWTFELDDRRYIALADDKVLALQFYLDMAMGEAPFDRLPALGGQHRMRGFYEGRYRDSAYMMFQGEYRQVLGGRWGYVLFGAVGDVADDITRFHAPSFKFAGGAGLRFLFNKEEHVNIRVDFGVGRDTNGVYFGVEEAF